ncbi:MAG: hypothetical protein PVG22_17845, partial [Chromatiales bacterium]
MSAEQSASPGKTGLSRADLLWAFFVVDEAGYAKQAELLGFEEIDTPHADLERPPQSPTDLFVEAGEEPPQVSPAEDETQTPESVSTSSSYYRIVGRQVAETRPATQEQELTPPDWFTQAEPTILQETESRIPLVHRVVPLYEPLTPWSRLLPMLQRVLGDNISSSRPDIPRLVKKVADRTYIRRIPRRQRQTWAPAALVLIDINEHNFPYRRDFIHLREQLIDARGDEGLEIQYIHDEPGGTVARYVYGREVLEPWRVPEKGTPILILSDLAMQGGSRRELYAWLVFGQLLQAQGFRPVVLMPVAERNIDKRLLKYFDCIVWDRNSRLKRVKGAYQPEQDKQNHREAIDQMLACCFSAVRVDAGLLRAVRELLPARDYDIGHEAMLWKHPAVIQEGDEWGWQAGSKPRYLKAAEQLRKKLDRAQQERLVELIGRYHALYPDELYFEAMYGLTMWGLPVPEKVKKATEKFMRDMVATYSRNPDNTLLDGWVKRHLVRHEDKDHRKK